MFVFLWLQIEAGESHILWMQSTKHCFICQSIKLFCFCYLIIINICFPIYLMFMKPFITQMHETVTRIKTDGIPLININYRHAQMTANLRQESADTDDCLINSSYRTSSFLTLVHLQRVGQWLALQQESPWLECDGLCSLHVLLCLHEYSWGPLTSSHSPNTWVLS